jgi:hypothetical protein
MAINTEIPEGHRVVRYTYVTKQAEEATDRLIKGQNDLAAASRGGLSATGQAYDQLAKKIAEASTQNGVLKSKWKEASTEFRSVGVLEQAFDKFKSKIAGIPADIGKMAFSLGVAQVAGEAFSAVIDGLGEVLAETFGPGHLITEEDLKVWESYVETDGLWGDAIRSRLPAMREEVELRKENHRVLTVLQQSQQELLGFLNKGADAAEVYNDKQLLLNKWLREGTINADQFAVGLQHVREEFEKATDTGLMKALDKGIVAGGEKAGSLKRGPEKDYRIRGPGLDTETRPLVAVRRPQLLGHARAAGAAAPGRGRSHHGADRARAGGRGRRARALGQARRARARDAADPAGDR